MEFEPEEPMALTVPAPSGPGAYPFGFAPVSGDRDSGGIQSIGARLFLLAQEGNEQEQA
jgi:hypothetical protein